MTVTKLVPLAVVTLVFVGGFALGGVFQGRVDAQSKGRVYELRTYTTPDGKLADLHARFRNHTVKLFEKHGMTNVGYFLPQDAPLAKNTLIYVLAHKDRETAKQSWDEFRKDPDWVKARTTSEVNGPLTTQVVSVFMDPLDFSKMK
jgi:NIPSNAP